MKWNKTSLQFSFTEANAKIVTEEKGLQDVVNAMATHPKIPELVETAAAAMLSLSMEGQYLITQIMSEIINRLIIQVINRSISQSVDYSIN